MSTVAEGGPLENNATLSHVGSWSTFHQIVHVEKRSAIQLPRNGLCRNSTRTVSPGLTLHQIVGTDKDKSLILTQIIYAALGK